jgi:two-component system, chemotaxis family, sensor kinase CheA
MGLSEKIRQQLISSFKAEQREHILNITQGLLALEKEAAAEARTALLADLFRAAHSLKGAARAVGMSVIENLGHGLEGLLLEAKEGQLDFSPELFDLLHQTVDAVELMLAQLEKEEPGPTPLPVLNLIARLNQALADPQTLLDAATARETTSRAAENTPAAALRSAVTDNTIRVSVSKLDDLMAQLNDLLTIKARLEQRLAETEQVYREVDTWQKAWRQVGGSYNRLMYQEEQGHSADVTALIDYVSQNQTRLRTVTQQVHGLSQRLTTDRMQLDLSLKEMETGIRQVRMLPLSTITVTLKRMVRDMARQQDKQVRLTIVGDDIELDKQILEQVKDPIIHLLRNGVDHGIEPAAVREQAGKAAAGQITLTANQRGSHVVIMVQDDGSGLDLEAIRKTAVQKGIITQQQAGTLGSAETMDLVFRSGLTTSKIITDISGRGIGLDVVRQNVESLQGTLQVTSEPNQGTTFTLMLPLTLASSRGLLVQAAGQQFALPLLTIERVLRLPVADCVDIENGQAISYEGRLIALARLADLLKLPADNNPTPEFMTVVIVAAAEKRLGLIIDQVNDEQEIVTKKLGPPLLKIAGIAGATILGTGKVVLVLHTADLLKLVSQTPAPSQNIPSSSRQTEASPQKTILVVDDSITTRTLEKNILEAAGYQVMVAINGEEALSLLISETRPDLIVSDINMPRLDGFEMTARLKQDALYSDIPIILVSSLDSTADKARGITVGAEAYIVKSKFDQGNLLDIIEQLIGKA